MVALQGMAVDEPDVLPHSERIFDNCHNPAKFDLGIA
jgi:hypothetical protein